MTSLDDETDAQLLRSWHGGDQRAGHRLFSRYHRPITRFFMRRLSADAEDLVQKTFLGLLEGIDRFDGDAFRPYLFGTARNVLLKHYRDSSRHKQRFNPAETSIAALDPDWEAVRMVHEQNKLLVAALRCLPIDTQMLLELFYWEKMPVKQIALALELNHNTVKIRMHRGRKQLEQHMAELSESPTQLRTTLHRLSAWEAEIQAEIGERIEPVS